MNKIEQRLALAEWMGHDTSYTRFSLENFKDRDGFPDAIFTLARVPDFLNDLNEIHNAEMQLDDEQHEKFRRHLLSLCQFIHPQRQDILFVSACAAHRAEALLKCLNLWQE